MHGRGVPDGTEWHQMAPNCISTYEGRRDLYLGSNEAQWSSLFMLVIQFFGLRPSVFA